MEQRYGKGHETGFWDDHVLEDMKQRKYVEVNGERKHY
jgi:hypothetical protein